MQLTIGQEHVIRPRNDVHGLYCWLYWDLQLQCDWSRIATELQAYMIWHDASANFRNNHRYHGDWSECSYLAAVTQMIEQHGPEFLDLAWESECDVFRRTWYKGTAAYKTQARVMCKILKDTPGFSMSRHLDNNHIMMQGIINLLPNDPGTQLFLFDSIAPCRQMPGDQGSGLMFVNTAGSIHAPGEVTKDRYILYYALVI